MPCDARALSAARRSYGDRGQLLLRKAGRFLAATALLGGVLCSSACSQPTPVPALREGETALAPLSPAEDPTRPAPTAMAATPSAAVSPSSPSTATATIAPLPATPTPSPSLPAGSVPTVLAEVSFAPAGGNVFANGTPAIHRDGRVVVLCDYQSPGQPRQPALALIDVRQAARGPILPLPFEGAQDIAVAQGLAYVEYRPDGERYTHLAAVDLESGSVVADVPLGGERLAEPFLVDAAGRVYLPLTDSLEVRAGTMLDVVHRMPWPADAYVRDWATLSLAMDPAGERLYLITWEKLRAFRTADLGLLWEVPLRQSSVGRLVADAAGRYLYAWYGEPNAGRPNAGRLVAYEAGTGEVVQELAFAPDPQAAGPCFPGASSSWELLAADSEQGYLLFLGNDDHGWAVQRMLWKTGPDGRPLLPAPTPMGHYLDYAVGDGRVLALCPEDHQASILDLADLRPLERLTLGVEIRDVVADPGQGRLYVDDSAGRLHVLDADDYRPIASLAAGSGPMSLDGPNRLLFVGRKPWGNEVAVVDTLALTVTAVLTGGDSVAVDSAGQRAFVGHGGYLSIQVWDTGTFAHLATIPFPGKPIYNPLRDELYLEQPGALYPAATIVDGKSLTVSGELRFDPPAEWTEPGPYAALMATEITVDVEQEVVTAGLAFRGKQGLDLLPEWRALSARTLEPLTHTVTLMYRPGGAGLIVLPAEDGRVYTCDCQEVAPRQSKCGTLVWRAGSEEVIERRDDLCFSFYLPHTGLTWDGGVFQAFDLATWEPLGSFADPGVRKVDPAARRLYAWEDGSTLTVLAYGD